MRNNGDLIFTDVAESAGVAGGKRHAVHLCGRAMVRL
jgi:hypothetical protein